MIFLGSLTVISPTKSQIGLVHSMPFDSVNGLGLSQSKLESIGILVNEVPDAAPPIGQQVSGMFVNPATKTVFYEYVEIPLTPDQIRDREVADIKESMDFLLMGGM